MLSRDCLRLSILQVNSLAFEPVQARLTDKLTSHAFGSASLAAVVDRQRDFAGAVCIAASRIYRAGGCCTRPASRGATWSVQEVPRVQRAARLGGTAGKPRGRLSRGSQRQLFQAYTGGLVCPELLAQRTDYECCLDTRITRHIPACILHAISIAPTTPHHEHHECSCSS